MPDDPVGDVRLFQVSDIFRSQFYRQSADRLFQVSDLCRADDGRGYRLFLQQPGQRDLRARAAVLFRDFRNPLDDLPVGLLRRTIF